MSENRSKFSMERIEYIRSIAKDLFTKYQISFHRNDEGGIVQTLPTPKQFEQIMEVIGDSGLIFISTWEDLAQQWVTFRNEDTDVGTGEFLIQMGITFRACAFEDEHEYRQWVSHLANAYGHQSPSERLTSDLSNRQKEMVVIDDDLVERLPTQSTHQDLMMANPWFTFLISLQLSFHEIWDMMIEANRKLINQGAGGES